MTLIEKFGDKLGIFVKNIMGMDLLNDETQEKLEQWIDDFNINVLILDKNSNDVSCLLASIKIFSGQSGSPNTILWAQYPAVTVDIPACRYFEIKTKRLFSYSFIRLICSLNKANGTNLFFVLSKVSLYVFNV